jgi:hypothetical protein
MRGCRESCAKEAEPGAHIPVNVAVVLSACSKVRVQLDAGKCALLPLDSADEANGPAHVPRHIHLVPQSEVVASSGWGTRPGSGRHLVFARGLVVQGGEWVALGRIGDGG